MSPSLRWTVSGGYRSAGSRGTTLGPVVQSGVLVRTLPAMPAAFSASVAPCRLRRSFTVNVTLPFAFLTTLYEAGWTATPSRGDGGGPPAPAITIAPAAAAT